MPPGRERGRGRRPRPLYNTTITTQLLRPSQGQLNHLAYVLAMGHTITHTKLSKNGILTYATKHDPTRAKIDRLGGGLV